MATAGFASLFNISEEDLKKKGKVKEIKPDKKDAKKSKKKQSTVNVTRFSLPVHVRCGYICMDFTADEFGGKTLDEKSIKIKLKEQYPELSGVSFQLRDFKNTVAVVDKEAHLWLKNNRIGANNQLMDEQGLSDGTDLYVPDSEEATDTFKDSAGAEGAISEEISQESGDSDGIPDFAGAEPEMGEKISDGYVELVQEENISKADGQEGNMQVKGDCTSEAEVKLEHNGSWVTLQIFYQEVAEKQKFSFPLTLVNGDYKIPVDEMMGLSDMKQLWIDSYPEYKGCKLYYDEHHHLLVPFMEVDKEQDLMDKEFRLPITVGNLHLNRVYTSLDFGEEEQDSVTLEDIRKLYGRTYPEYRFGAYYYNEEDNILFPIVTKDEKNTGSERMKVPVTVRMIGTEIILQESDFKGKRNVSLEDVRQVIEEIYPEYSKERTEMVVDERDFVVPILRASRKGYDIKQRKGGCGLYTVIGRDQCKYRVENMPYGIFECRVDGADPQFHLTGPKIPMEILEQVIGFFKLTPTTEAAIQLFCLPNGTYEIYVPKQVCTDSTVEYLRSREREEEWTLMLDIHSHGRYPAFFSCIDDRDEKGTRLFLVIGNLDTEHITYAFRAGIAGFYQQLQIEDVFGGGAEW